MSNQLPVPFTPGPWVCQPSSHPDVGTLIKPIPGQVVAVVERLPNEASNARLIAAAPELLDCLIDLLDADGDLYAMDFNRYRAAVAAATGGDL